MEILTGIGLAAPAGLNAYVPLLAVALAQRAGWLELEAPYDLIGEWWIVLIVAVLFIVEAVADKIPAADSVNDVIQTVLRPAAGGILFAATSSAAVDVHPAALIVAGVVLAGGVHAAKASARPAINASTGGMGGPIVSTVEDVVAAGISAVAIAVPVLVVFLLALFAYAFWRFRRRTAAKEAA